MTFVADAPQTRTLVDIVGDNKAQFSWSNNGEYVAFIQWDNGKVGSNDKKSKEGSIADGKAEFSAEFKQITDAVGNYNYIAVYPYVNFERQDVAGDYIRAKVPATQTLIANSFDPNADLLISAPINDVPAMGNNDVASMSFARVAAIGKMTLKGVNEGEIIKSVTFIWGTEVHENAAEGNRFVGSNEFNFEGNITAEAYEGQNYVKLVADPAKPEIKSTSAGADIYFTCLPGAYSGTYTIEVVTNVATYSKSATLAADRALNFTAGNVLSFGLGFTESHRKEIQSNGFYRKVTSNLADFSGEYLIVYEDGNLAFDGSLTDLDDTSNTINVTIDDNAIEATDVVKKSAFTIAKVNDGYTIKSASGYYIGRDATSNGLNSDTSTAYINTISIEDGCAVIRGSGGLALKYNKASSHTRFRYYTTNQQGIQLYRLDDGTQGGDQGGETPSPTPDPDPEPGTGSAKTLTINSEYFNGTSYAANNNDKIIDGITITSNHVKLSSSKMQWQKSNGYIYNKTEMGTIKSIKFTGVSGSFSVKVSNTEKDTDGTDVGNVTTDTTLDVTGSYSYFYIETGSSATGYCDSIVITYE